MIGIYVISKDVNLEYYKSHFMIQDHLLLNCYEHYSYGRILHETLNPIFLKSTRFILKEIMRLSKKTALFFEVINYFINLIFVDKPTYFTSTTIQRIDIN